jgi:hypothetical protein
MGNLFEITDRWKVISMTKKLVYEQLNMDVQMVETTYDTYSLSRRYPPSAVITRFGRTRTNVEGGEEWQIFFCGSGRRSASALDYDRHQ